MRKNLQAAMTPFDKNQAELNTAMKDMKEGAMNQLKNKHDKSYEGARSASDGRKQYRNAKTKVEKNLDELEKMVEDDKARQASLQGDDSDREAIEEFINHQQ